MDKKRLLQVAPDINLELESQNLIKVKYNNQSYKGSRQTLSIINEFYLQKTFEEGVKKLSNHCASQMHWINLVEEIKKLHRLQILETPNQQQRKIISSHHSRFDSAPVHIAMLNDFQRTVKYQNAISDIVTPEDIVLDIGTGTGILAMTAAKAGAKHVYAIEQFAIGKVAKKAFAYNGLADKITLIEGNSKEVRLPEKATVLVSEIIGNDPLQEGVLKTTKDAINRHLTPNAKFIPADLKLYALPITIPYNLLSKYDFNSEMIKVWQENYKIDFSQLKEDFKSKKPTIIMKNSFEIRDWPILSDPVLLSNISLSNINNYIIESKSNCVINKGGVFNGLLLYFSTQLSEKIELSTHPNQVDRANSWLSVIWVLNEQWNVKKGDNFSINYKFKNRSKFNVKREK